MNRKLIYSLLLPLLALSYPSDAFAKTQSKNFVVTEIHYLIKDDGSIDRNTVIEKRTLEYKGGKFVTGVSTVNNKNTVLTTDEVKNEKGIHKYTRNERNDVITDSITVETGPNKQSITVYTYEYFYLGKFTHATNKEGVTAVSGYINDPDAAWVLKTVRCNGKVCQHVERKYKKGN